MYKTLLSVALASLLSTVAVAQPGQHGRGGHSGGIPGGQNGGGGNPTPNVPTPPVTPNQNTFTPSFQPRVRVNPQNTFNPTFQPRAGDNTFSPRSDTASTSSSRSSVSSRNYNAGNNQTMGYYEARDRRQAPGIAASFSSVAGNPCEGVPFGLGGSMPGYGALLQIPRESGNCWHERQAILLHAWGYQNAAIAVLSGNPVGVAVQNNPATYYAPRKRYRNIVRAKH